MLSLQRNTFITLLLAALLTMTLMHGLAGTIERGHAVAEFLTLVVHATGVYAVCRTRRQLVVGLTLTALSVAATTANVLTKGEIPLWAGLDSLTLAALMAYFVTQLLKEILGRRQITAD